MLLQQLPLLKLSAVALLQPPHPHCLVSPNRDHIAVVRDGNAARRRRVPRQLAAQLANLLNCWRLLHLLGQQLAQAVGGNLLVEIEGGLDAPHHRW